MEPVNPAKKNYPQEIEKRGVYLFNITLERDAAKERLQAYEDAIACAVITERDAGGKPQYSNDRLREIEIRKRCAESVTYADLRNGLESLEVLKTQAALALERVRNEFAVWKIEQRKETADKEAVST